MKLAIYDDYKVGVVEGQELYDVTSALAGGDRAWPYPYLVRMAADWEAAAPAITAERKRAKPVPVSSVRLRAPMPFPHQLFAAPTNYQKHIGELGARSVSSTSADKRGFFMKAPASLVGAGERIELPRGSARRFDHESELAVIIGRQARNVSRADAMKHVFGYSCLIDLTMRIEPGVADEERVMRKSFQTFTPMGPYLVTADDVPDPQALGNQLWVNGELRQSANTRDMVVDVARLIELISSVVTLYPGDVIATGTPEGVGPVQPGDSVRIAIENVGDMTLPVVEADQVSPRAF